jgi:hypothetical protein
LQERIAALNVFADLRNRQPSRGADPVSGLRVLLGERFTKCFSRPE